MRLTDEELDTLEAQAATWDAPLLPPGAWHCQSIDGALAKKAVAELRAARAALRPTEDDQRVLQAAATYAGEEMALFNQYRPGVVHDLLRPLFAYCARRARTRKETE